MLNVLNFLSLLTRMIEEEVGGQCKVKILLEVITVSQILSLAD